MSETFWCVTCETTNRNECVCDRHDTFDDGDLAEAGPIRYRIHERDRETVMERRLVEGLPEDEDDRLRYLRMWAVAHAVNKMLNLGFNKEADHLADAVKVTEVADVLVGYIETGTVEATRTLVALANQGSKESP